MQLSILFFFFFFQPPQRSLVRVVPVALAVALVVVLAVNGAAGSSL